MKHPFNARAPAFDADAINATIQRALASAGLDTTAGPMREVTDTIRRALGGSNHGLPGHGLDGESVIDVVARVIPAVDEPVARREPQLSIGEAQHPTGRFETHAFSNDAGQRSYKVYVPSAQPEGPRAMIVMLHGCTQSADDFATGTQMNRLADKHGFLVVYPEQNPQANPSKCWNWFNPQDQQRGTGEPSLIAGITRKVADTHGADVHRIFVAGLSAGAAMAVVLGETYPELFSGVGAHSGLPYGSAHDIPSALATMKGGRSGTRGPMNTPVAAATPSKKALQAVPTIVFHGDRDHTVQQANGTRILQQVLDAHGAQAMAGTWRTDTQTGITPGGQRFSRTVHADINGRSPIESWTVHGAGHAWSGGHASGSYTNAKGPDASAEMVRFFMALPRSGSV